MFFIKNQVKEFTKMIYAIQCFMYYHYSPLILSENSASVKISIVPIF